MEKNAGIYRNDASSSQNNEMMLSARIHEYQKPLMIDNIPRPKVAYGEEVLIVLEQRTL
jgi:hypothetical protein